MEGPLHILSRLLLLELGAELWDQTGPLLLDKALAHERDTF